MTPERWQRVKAIVAEAMEAPPAERDARLERQCGDDAELRREVESLLGYAETTTATARDWGPPPLSPLPVRASLPAGARIGVYRIDRLLGEGGMGAVYLAHREVDGYAMPVALKIIRSAALSEYALTRFRRERQILARLAHPNITKLLDGGVTDDGLPYLVTEYIHGVPLDEHLRLHALELAQKLDLFLALCSALSFAHRNLVVHGDLKPGNILVTAEGTPKLLDFGIARLIDPDRAEATATATFAMTRRGRARNNCGASRPRSPATSILSGGSSMNCWPDGRPSKLPRERRNGSWRRFSRRRACQAKSPASARWRAISTTSRGRRSKRSRTCGIPQRRRSPRTSAATCNRCPFPRAGRRWATGR